MTLSYVYDGAALTPGITFDGLNLTQRAESGEAGFGGLPIEDPDAALALVGHKSIVVEESDCSQPRLFTGWTTQRDTGRSAERGMLVEDQRLMGPTLVDLNAALSFRMISGTAANRPAETWATRIAWITGSTFLSTLVTDFAHMLSIPAGWGADATDYRGRYPKDVFADLLMQVEDNVPLNMFCYFCATHQEVALFLGGLTAGTSDSTLSISNVLSDRDGITCFEPSKDTVLVRDPSGVFSEVMLIYDNGTKRYRVSRQSTADAFIERGTTIEVPHVRNVTRAALCAKNYLDRHSVEEDRITTTIIVPSSAAGLAIAGQRINVRFSHLPGYEAWRSMRIVTSNPVPMDTGARYAIALELVAPRAASVVAALQTLTASAVGDGSTVIHYANTYDLGPDPCPGMVTGQATAIGGHWYRTYFQYASTCFPQGGGCYPLDAAFFVGTYDPGQFTTEPPQCRIAQLDIAADADSGFVGPGTGTRDGAQGWTHVGGNYPAAGEAVPIYLGLHANVDGPGICGTITVWIEDLGPGDTVGPYATPPDPVLPWAVAADDEENAGPAPGAPVQSTSNPAVTDDADHGFTVGQHWVNTATGKEYVLVDATAGAAVWVDISAGAIEVLDEGGSLTSTVASLNFTGAGVTATAVGDAVTVNVPSGGLTVREVDTAPSVAATVLELPNGTLTDEGGGVARYTPAAGGGVSGVAFPIVCVFDNGTADITGNPEVDVHFVAAGTFTEYSFVANAAGSAQLDIWKGTAAGIVAGSPPTVADTIFGGGSTKPILTSDMGVADSTLTGVDTTIAAGDVWRFHLDSSSGVKRLEFMGKYTRS